MPAPNSILRILLVKISSLFKSPLKLLIFAIGTMALVLVLWLISLTLEPHPEIKSIVVSNVSDRSVTLSWASNLPTKGRLYVNKSGKFGVFPNLKRGLLDDQLQVFDRNIRLDTHLITLDGLTPETTYFARVYQGIWSSKLYSFKTLPTFNAATVPNPVYGKILEPDRKTPAAGVIVYLTLKNATNSATLAVLTTANGAWQLDLANVKVNGGKELFPLTPATTIKLVVEAGLRGQIQAQLKLNQLTPVPDIVLSKAKQ
ncbi:hypothetical protein A2631_01250 [Candidatus Daviesbacteria bacterium RIFCSPHIGHO2_01_FULL_44_29]|uniref:Fibronectin type-III domain-containing protein n=1 Tax=Candidatus Daviesbacteria bacterium RIFCSPHIGHO2_02_FULL_43_12 TaxID=1797776 RepID=A0A1F5KIG8_9BACT|nr:MAG: hypothetical protein A2631_01250 [Candidatus Daviesbacteria bacterium RIFCSPHIGHO2_01_FULL_44_29]OGE40362.1 MAG: hypothetical protein A3E86_01105 [Candidatus Daviesbacteria bacterium RIFCSPHIGHO2_12_FULL_47_45]OGE40702.1 MAG: hypothetical protein A3D25_05495 [Candidatus Daviesbacteria bacterium RIFCSPHIGHO2_02_FULL_43_12]OGE69801.1 MAG: hypothetical protein A3B55_05315 [Candidatus Daviesbacteria bacterium RIFCSPLOWO2_01_FULL_43_15]